MTGSANGAEDIVQECFLALWRKPDVYDPNRGALRAFLLGIARKLVLKRWRDEHPHDSLEEDSSICGRSTFWVRNVPKLSAGRFRRWLHCRGKRSSWPNTRI